MWHFIITTIVKTIIPLIVAWFIKSPLRIIWCQRGNILFLLYSVAVTFFTFYYFSTKLYYISIETAHRWQDISEKINYLSGSCNTQNYISIARMQKQKNGTYDISFYMIRGKENAKSEVLDIQMYVPAGNFYHKNTTSRIDKETSKMLELIPEGASVGIVYPRDKVTNKLDTGSEYIQLLVQNQHSLPFQTAGYKARESNQHNYTMFKVRSPFYTQVVLPDLKASEFKKEGSLQYSAGGLNISWSTTVKVKNVIYIIHWSFAEEGKCQYARNRYMIEKTLTGLANEVKLTRDSAFFTFYNNIINK